MAIVLPDSILGSPGLGYIRQWIIKNTRLVSSIDLHADTFQPRNGTQTSILVLVKKTREEIQDEEKRGLENYNVFMAIVDRIGHDKRGNPIFKRDKYGNDILVPETEYELVGTEAAFSSVSKVKVIDDQSLEIPTIFSEWKEKEGLIW